MSMNTSETYGLGWLRDLPDFRDYTPEHPKVKPHLAKIKTLQAAPAAPPPAVDLRAWCSPIENQGALGSCTANAAIGLMEYYERRAFGRHIDASRLFLYKASRNLLHWTGDTGAFLRTAMGAMVLFGAPPEEFWPYDISRFDIEPGAFCYAFAENFKTISYYRFDPPGTDRVTLLKNIKAWLAAGLPSMFGFTVYNSIGQAAATGKIPFPTAGETILGGHAIVAVGYDDTIQIHNSNANGPTTTGAFLIRNSWGAGWGVGGYGYLPYDYVLRGIAVDWWSLIKADYVNTPQFH
jgi:C1A family cysteine protease